MCACVCIIFMFLTHIHTHPWACIHEVRGVHTYTSGPVGFFFLLTHHVHKSVHTFNSGCGIYKLFGPYSIIHVLRSIYYYTCYSGHIVLYILFGPYSMIHTIRCMEYVGIKYRSSEPVNVLWRIELRCNQKKKQRGPEQSKSILPRIGGLPGLTPPPPAPHPISLSEFVVTFLLLS